MQEFGDWLDPSTRFTIGGCEFRVEPSALVVLELHAAVARGDYLSDLDVARRVLGSAMWSDLIDAGVSQPAMIHASRAVAVNYLGSADEAKRVWIGAEKQPEPEPVATRREPSIWGVAPDDAVDPPGTMGPHDPGGGPYRPKYGDRVWYYPWEYANRYLAEQGGGRASGSGVQWADVFAAWNALILDFDSLGHDLTPDLLRRRPWPWFAVRLAALVAIPSSHVRRAIDFRKVVTGGDSAGISG